jgi:ABC-type transport system involved in multi-copper enzyme maturation permease subunit
MLIQSVLNQSVLLGELPDWLQSISDLPPRGFMELLPVWLQPVWIAFAGAALVLLLMAAIYQLLKLVLPKVAAILLITAKEAMAQPLFYVSLALGSFLILMVFPFLPYNTFGEDIKMLKDSGLTVIMLLSILMALWTASVSIADEIEGRTALTLLSKPVARWQFIIGKFLGILAPVALMFVVLGTLFLGSVSYKVSYDARENSQSPPTAEQCLEEMAIIVPGIFLAFLEAIVLTSISVAISTRLPMLPNLVICWSIYVLGHLVPLLVQSSVGEFEIVRFVGQFIATILPVLEHFNMQAAVATGRAVPLEIVAWATLYCFLYSSFAILGALFLFEDRDLA